MQTLTGRVGVVTKYKKKKPTSKDASTEVAEPTAAPSGTNKSTEVGSGVGNAVATTAPKKPKRLATGSIKLQFAGDLILVKNSEKALSGFFKRYASLFEALANMPKDQRGLVYKIMTGLMLTSHAKKSNDTVLKRKLFDLKNELFLRIANDRSLRQQIEFKYLATRNFRVLKYCAACSVANTALGVDRFKWKYCKKCEVDHNFYNLLSLEFRFAKGFARMFISNDQVRNIENFKVPPRIKSDSLAEEAIVDQFHYNSRNLDAIDLDSIIKLHGKLLAVAPPPKSTKTLSASPSVVTKNPVKKSAR